MNNSISLIDNQQNSFGLTNRDMLTIKTIIAKYSEITELKLFGSRAKGDFKKGSDIDLAVMNENVSDDLILKLSVDFQESSLPYRVDLVNYTKLNNIELKSHIDRVGISPFKNC